MDEENRKKLEEADSVAKKMTPLQYLETIFSADGIDKMSHILVPLPKLREIYSEMLKSKEVGQG